MFRARSHRFFFSPNCKEWTRCHDGKPLNHLLWPRSARHAGQFHCRGVAFSYSWSQGSPLWSCQCPLLSTKPNLGVQNHGARKHSLPERQGAHVKWSLPKLGSLHEPCELILSLRIEKTPREPIPYGLLGQSAKPTGIYMSGRVRRMVSRVNKHAYPGKGLLLCKLQKATGNGVVFSHAEGIAVMWWASRWYSLALSGPGGRGLPCCVSVVPRRRVCEQDAHSGARGWRLEPVGCLEHVQPDVWDRSPLPAEEVWQPPVSPLWPGILQGALIGVSKSQLFPPDAKNGLSPEENLSLRGKKMKSLQGPWGAGLSCVIWRLGFDRALAVNMDAGSPVVSWLLIPLVGLGRKLSWDSWVTISLCRHPQSESFWGSLWTFGKNGWPSDWLWADLGAAWLWMSHKACGGSAVLFIQIFFTCALRTVWQKTFFCFVLVLGKGFSPSLASFHWPWWWPLLFLAHLFQKAQG